MDAPVFHVVAAQELDVVGRISRWESGSSIARKCPRVGACCCDGLHLVLMSDAAR